MQLSTHEVIYVAQATSGVFLDLVACIALGVVLAGFLMPPATPFVGATFPYQGVRRTQPPSLPTSLPFPPTNANLDNLRMVQTAVYGSGIQHHCMPRPSYVW